MATPNPYQLQQLEEKGKDPARYQSMGQPLFDRLFPPTPPAGSVPTTVSPPVTSGQPTAPTPPVTTPTPPAPTVIDLTGDEPRVVSTPPVSTPQLEVQPQIQDVDLLRERAGYLQRRSVDPLGVTTSEREQAEIRRADAIMGQAFTPGGAPRVTVVPVGRDPLIDPESTLGNLMGAFSPQRIQTGEESRAQRTFELRASQLAAQTLLEENQSALARARDEGNEQAAALFERNIEQLRNRPDDYQQYRIRKREIMSTGSYRPGFQFQPVMDEAGQRAAEGAREVFERAMTTERYGGEIVESPFAYTARLSTAPIALGATAVERAAEETLQTVPGSYAYAAATGQGIGEQTIAEGAEQVRRAAERAEEEDVPLGQQPFGASYAQRVREGMGFMGAGADVADFAADAAGLPESFKESTAGTAARYLGGAGGLAFDLALPIVPGTTSLVRGVRAGAQASELGSALGMSPTSSALRAGINEAIRSARGGIGKTLPYGSRYNLRGRYIFPEYVEGDIYGSVLARYSNDPGRQAQLMSFIDDTARITEKIDVSDWNSITRAERRSRLESVLGSSDKVDEYIARGRALDLDPIPPGDNAAAFQWSRLHNAPQEFLQRASLERGLSTAGKQSLGRGAAYASDAAINDLANYARSLGFDDPAKVNPQVSEFLMGLPDDVFDSVVARLGATADELGMSVDDFKKALSPDRRGYVALSSATGDARRAVAKQILIDTANRTLREKSPLLLPDFVRMTRTSFLPAAQAQKAMDEFLASPFIKIRDDVAKTGDQVVRVTRKQLEQMKEVFVPFTIRSEDYIDVLDEIGRLTRAAVDEGADFATMTRAEFNAMMERALDVYAQQQPGYKSLYTVQQDVQAIAGRLDTQPAQATMDLEVYTSKVLTPKEVAGGNIESLAGGVVKAGINKTVDSGVALRTSPMSDEIITELGRKFGAIPEDFKARYRQNRALGLNPTEAWAKTMADNYVRREVIETLYTEGTDIFTVTQDSYRQMFFDYVAQAYGGYESIVDALNATGRTQFLDAMLVSPAEMRQLVWLMTYDDRTLGPLLKRFQDAMMNERYTEGLMVLRDAHAVLQGKPISTFIPSQGQLKKLYQQAMEEVEVNKFAAGGIGWGYELPVNKPFDTPQVFKQDSRGILQIWDNAKESAPMFLADDHLELLGAQYLTRRMANVVEETFEDWNRIYPELFPSERNIDIAATPMMQSFLARKYPDIDATINRVVVDPDAQQAVFDEIQNVLVGMRKDFWLGAVSGRLSGMSGTTIKDVALFNAADAARKKLAQRFKEMFDAGVIAEPEYNSLRRAFVFRKNNVLFQPDDISYLSRISGADSYVSSIYPLLRAETTPLFYNTLKTSLRQAARSNRAIITEGVLESTLRMPLTFSETSGVRTAVLGKANLDVFTETMLELQVSSKARKLPADVIKDMEEGSLNARIQKGIDAVTDIRGQESQSALRLNKIAADLFGTPTAAFNDGRFAKIAKGGVLGGQLLPNFRYLTTNYLTAPAIVYGSLGGQYGGAALKAMVDPDVYKTMRALTGGRAGGVMASTADVSPMYAAVDEVVLFNSPTRQWTNYDIARLAASSGLSRGQASAELTENVVRELVAWSAVNSKKAQGLPAGANLNDAFRGEIQQFLKEAYGSAFVGNKSMNMFSEVANYTDTQFRIAVLIEALKSGRTEQQALQLATESLFDYGNLSAFEKQYINKVFWFWTFRRNSYRQVMKSFLTNPARLKNAYLANNYLAEMDRDYNFTTADYAAFRPFVALMEDKEANQRYSLHGPSIPQLQAYSDLIDYMSLFPIIAAASEKENSRELISGLIEGTTTDIIGGSRPSIQFLAAMTFGVDPSQEGRRLGTYLDPRLMWYLQQNPDVWATFSSIVGVEVVPPEDEKPERGYYQGRQWRIKQDDEASRRIYYALNTSLLTVGIQRNLRDYAPLLQSVKGLAVPPTEQLPIQTGRSFLENALYTGGVITPIAAPDIETRIKYNQRTIRDALRE